MSGEIRGKEKPMRKTVLNRTSILVASILLAVAAALAAVRTTTAQDRSGKQLFESKGCAQCHYTDRQKSKGGPSLKGLFNSDKLPVSGRRATVENVKKQLKNPYRNMPSFADRLNAAQTDALIDYLKDI